eukprot:TRINITY_DN104943_c0_g1_i1.p1 TRINITY_DN104943_c0_g1~~TRINITY_DN104943_c0_g1_i1.p1  ORF type:complete len:171 (+),score=43.14 TRINITY_DN104943_c0_g1_i1:54-566(+)
MANRVPPCKWAQRADAVFLTINIQDAKGIKIDFGDKTFGFTGTGQIASGTFDFELKLNLNSEITPAESKYKVTQREIQVTMDKKEKGPFWERMTEEPSKTTKNFLSCDWDRWRDEDDDDYNAMPAGFGGMDDMDFGGEDSDDEEADDEPNLDDLNISGGDDGNAEGEGSN